MKSDWNLFGSSKFQVHAQEIKVFDSDKEMFLILLLGLLSLFPECNPGPISTTPKETTDDPGSATSLKTPGSATLLAITIVTGVLNLHC